MMGNPVHCQSVARVKDGWDSETKKVAGSGTGEDKQKMDHRILSVNGVHGVRNTVEVWERTLKIKHKLPFLRTGNGGREQQLRLNSEISLAGSTALLGLPGRAAPTCVPHRRSCRWKAW